MKLLEYQAKQELARFGIAIPVGAVARTPEQAASFVSSHGAAAIKAQVPIGGRGKAGGIAVVTTPEQAATEAQRILGLDIRGYPVPVLWCETAVTGADEWYLGVTVDRGNGTLALMLSAAGGMEIEEVAATTPEKIARAWIHPWRGIAPYDARGLVLDAVRSGLPDVWERRGDLMRSLTPVILSLTDAAVRLDALTCEINPLMIRPDGTVIAADAKIEIDDNALFRHRELVAQLESEGEGALMESDPLEREARKRGLTYVHLGGSIGCIGNGAGLVMNTLDLVKQHGGAPANFLDVGGGASADKVKESLAMVLLDHDVRGIFINIFGGITRCDEVAKGIIRARDELKMSVPLVVRMTGTQEEEGRRLLEKAGIVPGTNASEAARAIVELAGRGETS